MISWTTWRATKLVASTWYWADTYQGKTLMGEAFWDDVNYMWPYLMNGLPEIAKGKDWSTRFPDQPITFSVKQIAPDRLLLYIYAEDEEYVKKKVPKRDYMSALPRALDNSFGIHWRHLLCRGRTDCPAHRCANPH